MRTFRSTLIGLLLGLTAFAVVGATLLSLFLPTLIQRFGCAPYGIRCTVGRVSIRPHHNLTADLAIDHVTLDDPDGRGTAFRVKRLIATLNISALLRTHHALLTGIWIESPELLIRQQGDGRWNLAVLAQQVQQHLKPATQPTTLHIPRITVTGGAIHINDHRVTDAHITLEPKPTPFLFEMQARAAVDGRSVRISGNVKQTLDGQMLAEIQETMRAVLRFRLDQTNRAIGIPEWSIEAEGAAARGTATVGYGEWPPVYTLTVDQWRADLGALAQPLTASRLTGLTGTLEGEPTTLQGRWPEPPVGEVTMTLTNGGLERPAQQLGITELTGRLSLQRTGGSRLRLQAALQAQAALLLGRRHDNPSLHASVSVDTASGDITAEALRASIPGALIEAKASGRRWGRNGFDLTTTQLKIEPTLLAHLSHWAGSGVLIKSLTHPAIYLSWPGGDLPWKADISSRSLHLSAAAMNGSVTLQPVHITAQGTGVSGRHLEGILTIGQADLAGWRLRTLKARFEIDPDQVRIPEFHVAVAGGTIDGHTSFSRAALLQKARAALSIRGLHPQALFAPTGKSVETKGVSLDTELSADVVFGGSRPSTADGIITLRALSLNLARHAAEPAPLLTGIRGDVTFTLHGGVLTINETAIRTDEGLALILGGSLPIGHNGGSATRLRLTVPWTEVSVLRSPLAVLTGGQPGATRFAGRIQAHLELIDQAYHGALSLQHVSMESGSLRLDRANGVIPLHGRIDQGSTSPLHQVAAQRNAGRSDLTEGEYHAALKRLSNVPAGSPFSLAVSSLRYDPIELRNIDVTFASSESLIDVRRFAFDAWSGRWSGWGTIEPLGGGIALNVLTDGLSLRAICDAFPPIKGYISGQIHGMATLMVPRFALDQAYGSARFWAADAPQEKRKISRALIEKLAGHQIRYFSLFGVARRYNRGVLETSLKAGDLSFHELEISHTILGYKDLDVRVSPTFNRIGLTHLLESLSEAIERIRASAESKQ